MIYLWMSTIIILILFIMIDLLQTKIHNLQVRVNILEGEIESEKQLHGVIKRTFWEGGCEYGEWKGANITRGDKYGTL